MGKRSTISNFNFKGNVIVIDRCTTNVDGDKVCVTPWIMTEDKGKRGDTKQYLACKMLDIGQYNTSLSGEKCARITCVCEPKSDCNCGTTELLGGIKLGGFKKAKHIADESLVGDNEKLIHSAYQEKNDKFGL